MAFRIFLPRPCEEDWRGMAEIPGGRACERCGHAVNDLRGATRDEAEALFRADPSRVPCVLVRVDCRGEAIFRRTLTAASALALAACGHGVGDAPDARVDPFDASIAAVAAEPPDAAVPDAAVPDAALVDEADAGAKPKGAPNHAASCATPGKGYVPTALPGKPSNFHVP